MALKIDFMPSFDRESIAAELRRIAGVTGRNNVSNRDIEHYGRLCGTTVKRKFGSLRKANICAGLEPPRGRRFSNGQLLHSLTELWTMTERDSGRSPLSMDVKKYGLPFNATTVIKRFGGWRKAMVAVSNGTDALPLQQPRRRGSRRSTIPVGRRFQVFQRDMFTCRICKRSGVPIEVDHIIPVSRGGADLIENLQTLCIPCNRGKSNRMV